MKTIIAGSRTIDDEEVIHQAIQIFNKEGFTLTELVSGTAKGVDKTAESVCNGKVPIKRFPANWNEFGRAAGPIRNKQMAEYADALIAIWDGLSSGTANMISQAKKQENIKVILVFNLSTNNYNFYFK